MFVKRPRATLIDRALYIGGYIVRRIRDKVCEECRSKVSSSICPEDLKYAFLSIKNYSGAKEGLLAPSTSLVQLLILHLMINIRHHRIYDQKEQSNAER